MKTFNMEKMFAEFALIFLIAFDTSLIYAIDNPDAADNISQFESREIRYVEKIDNKENTNIDYLTAY